MQSIQKSKRQKPLELGPLNLSKSQYKPYMNGVPNRRGKQNLLTMGPVQNIIFDIPQIEEAAQPLQLSAIQKLRLKICKYFEQKSVKSKQTWEFYMKKAQIVESANSSWVQIETFLLKIILDLFNQCKTAFENINQLTKFKEQIVESQNQSNFNKTLQMTKYSDKNNKHNNHHSMCGLSKIDYSINQNSYTNFPKSNFPKPKPFQKLCKVPASPMAKNQTSQIQDTLMIQNETKFESNSQQFKISKLERQIEIYRQKIAKIERQSKSKLDQMEKKIQFQSLIKYNQTLQEKMKYQSQVQNKKFYNDVLLQQLKAINKKNAELTNEILKLRKESHIRKEDVGSTETFMQYKQMWFMQHEEILQLRLEIHRVNTEKEAEITKNKGLKQKLKQLSKNFNYNYNISMQNEKESQDLNRILKDFRDWLTFYAVPRVSKGMMNNNTFFPEMSLSVESVKQDYLDLLPKDDPTNYRLLRPNFFIYFQSYQGIIMTEKKFPQKKILPPIFYLTIRAILDAMFLHFTFTSDFNQWLSFPQFVISFLQKFEVNLETNKPTLRKIPCQSQDKIGFLLNVFNLEAVSTWQRQIFRGFLLEDFTLDQIFFYLDCRDHLLKGSQLNNNLGSFDTITYVRVNVAEEVMKEKLKNYDRQMIERLKKFISSKKKVKNNKELVDMNFVLKLLLEVYSIEKIKSQRFFYNNFKCKSASTKISYTEYSAFMTKNFQFLSKGDIARLYRQIYTLGVSHITYKTIHFICSTKGLFIPLLRNKSVSKFDVSNQNKYPKPFEDILFLHLQNSFSNMASGVDEFGLESIVSAGVSFNRFLHDCQSQKLQRSIFSNKLLEQVQKILKIRTILAWKNKKSIIHSQLTKDEIRQRLGHVLAIINQSDDDCNSRKRWKQLRQKAMKKLTRNFKIRIQQSLAQFKILDKKQYEMKIANVNDISKKKGDSEQQSVLSTPLHD